MASIQELPSGKFAVRYWDAGKHRSKTFSLERDAQVYKAEVERRKEMGGLIVRPADVPTVREEARSWMASRPDLSHNTQKLYAAILRLHVFPELGEAKLTDLRARRLEEWQGKLLRTTGPRALQQARGILSQILDRAAAHELIESNRLRSVKAPQMAPRRPIEVATPAQIEVMRSYFLERNRRDYALLISLMAYVGLRPPQEPMALMWSDVEGRRLEVRRHNAYGSLETGTKRRAGVGQRSVLLPDPVAAELQEFNLSQGRPRGLIFPRPDDQPWTKTHWDNWRGRGFKAARTRAELPDSFRPYDLRHSAASLMLASGRPLPEVAFQLGHSISVCADTYSHLVLQGEEIRPFDVRIREARVAAEAEREAR